MLSVKGPFAGLFTQGMVVHEPIVVSGQWVEPPVDLTNDNGVRSARQLSAGETGHRRHRDVKSKKKDVSRPGKSAGMSHGVDAGRLFRPCPTARLSGTCSVDPPRRGQGASQFVQRTWTLFDAYDADFGEDKANADLLRLETPGRSRPCPEGVERVSTSTQPSPNCTHIRRHGSRQLSDRRRRQRRALSTLARLMLRSPHLAEEAWTRLGEGWFWTPWPGTALAADDGVVLPRLRSTASVARKSACRAAPT
jgi:leucyl-tRNA synthetase